VVGKKSIVDDGNCKRKQDLTNVTLSRWRRTI